MWGWGWQYRRQQITASIWIIPLFWLGWFIWKAGYQFLAVVIVVAGLVCGGWVQWALTDGKLRWWAGRSSTAVNDPVYDIPLDEMDVPSNPAKDPLYDIGEDFEHSPTSPDPYVAGENYPGEGEAPPAQAPPSEPLSEGDREEPLAAKRDT